VAINGGANQQTSEAYVSPGANLVLTATASNDVSWFWNTGETVLRLSLSNVQTDGSYTVALKQGTGRISSLAYKVFVYQKNFLTDGRNYIINRKTRPYLSDLNTTYPVFRVSSENPADLSQLFSVSKDGTRYKSQKLITANAT